MPTTLPLIDTFTGTTGALLTAHHPDSDAALNWLLADPNATLDLFSGLNGVVSVKSDTSTYGAMAFIDVDLGGDDQKARFCPKLNSTYNGANESDFKFGDCGPMLRVTHADTSGSTKILTGYLCYYRYKTNTWNFARLTVNTSVPGSPSQTLSDLSSVAAPSPLVISAPERFFDFEVSGTSPVLLTLKESGATILSHSDSNAARVQTGRRPGIKIRAVNGNDPYLSYVEYDVLAAPLTAGADLALTYGVSATVGANLSLSYSVAAAGTTPVGADLALSYTALAAVGADLALSYAVAASPGAFTSQKFINNTGTLRNGDAVAWEWYPGGAYGALGAITPTSGSGNLTSTGYLALTGLPTGPGILLARTTADNGFYAEPGTVV